MADKRTRQIQRLHKGTLDTEESGGFGESGGISETGRRPSVELYEMDKPVLTQCSMNRNYLRIHMLRKSRVLEKENKKE